MPAILSGKLTIHMHKCKKKDSFCLYSYNEKKPRNIVTNFPSVKQSLSVIICHWICFYWYCRLLCVTYIIETIFVTKKTYISTIVENSVWILNKSDACEWETFYLARAVEPTIDLRCNLGLRE